MFDDFLCDFVSYPTLPIIHIHVYITKQSLYSAGTKLNTNGFVGQDLHMKRHGFHRYCMYLHRYLL